jgi:hypothetical protein
MKNKFHNSSGSVAPLAILFTFLSMLLIVAYLGQSSTIASMEKYRFAELRAQYVAEAGLNREAVDYLPYLDADTTVLVGKQGMEFGEDQDGNPLGVYKNISCYTQLMDGSTRKEFVAKSTGEVNYASTVGSTVTVQKTVFMSMVPSGFEEFMYFTNDEEPFGPNPSSFVSFGDGDELEGRVHTNSPTVTFSEWGCPEFTGSFTVTEPISYEGDTSCLNEMEDEDGVSIIDTVESIIFPPDNSIGILKANATRVFTADDMITFSPSQKDTLIMTEIEFDESGGFWATQWWYLVPPVVEDAGTSIGFYYDSIEVAAPFSPIEPYSLGLVLADGTDAYDPIENYDNAVWLYVSTFDINGNDNTTAMSTFESNDVVSIESQVDPDKKVDFTILNSNQVSSFLWRLQVNTFLPINYEGLPGIGFLEDEDVTLSRQGSSGTLNADVPFNDFSFFHNHSEPTGFGGPNENTICQANGFQHFDFRYWLCNDRYNVDDCYEDLNGDGEYNENDDKSFVLFQRTFFPYSGPEVIYVKGGQALVHGTVKGAYTVVTDYATEYRRHDNPNIADQIWGNIWLIDDIRYEDSNTSGYYLTDGAVIQPEDGGTDNVLGLVAGANIIIANTTPNGARNRGTTGPNNSRHIVINGALMALQGAFISHYWQNSVTSGSCYAPNSSAPQFSLGDGRGGHRNPVRPENWSGIYTGNTDYRGYVNLWGSIVQQERGYMMRNSPGPYNSGDIGYDKNYNYDYNLLDNPPPYYPDQSTASGVIVLKIKSYGNQPES